MARPGDGATPQHGPDGRSAADAIPRRSARVLPVSPDGAVLLLEARDPARPDDWHWVSVGGAVEPGETPQVAALRELREETGVRLEPSCLLGPVHRGTSRFSWDGVHYANDALCFAAALPRDTVVVLDGLEPLEADHVRGGSWFTAAQLGQVASQGRLAEPYLLEAAAAATAVVAATGQP